ncbi:hypothetical protein DFH09DRAFT_1119675 [Mycena vulgaris]|nr:hypothetical protein DFH09DRAFT_1119675 [Mycena vulgaris]
MSLDSPVASINILDLPVEITAEIFIHCLPESDHTPLLSKAPLLLGRICTQWRDIALSTPGLWCFFTVNNKSFDRPQVLLARAEMWLSRSRNYPLFLKIGVDEKAMHGDDPSSNFSALIAVLGVHSAQWHDVELIIPYSSFHAFDIPAGLPILKRVKIGASGPSSATTKAITMFQGASQLRQAHVVLLNVNHQTPMLALPWAHLTSFTGQTLDLTESMLVLTEATAIVDVHLFEMIEPGNAVSLQQLVSSLEILELESAGHEFQDSPSSLWRALTMPQLKELRMTFHPCGDFEAFIARSSVHLRDVVMRPGPSDRLCGCLSAMPATSSLTLEVIRASQLVGLIEFLQDSTNLRHLQDLTIMKTPGFKEGAFDYGPMLEVSAARRLYPGQGAARLERFTFTWHPSDAEYALDASVHKTLAPLIRDGLRVFIGLYEELKEGVY